MPSTHRSPQGFCWQLSIDIVRVTLRWGHSYTESAHPGLPVNTNIAAPLCWIISTCTHQTVGSPLCLVSIWVHLISYSICTFSTITLSTIAFSAIWAPFKSPTSCTSGSQANFFSDKGLQQFKWSYQPWWAQWSTQTLRPQVSWRHLLHCTWNVRSITISMFLN